MKVRLLVRMRELMRRSVRLFNWETGRDREYNFALRQVVGKGARVLDVGGCQSLLPLYLAKNGFIVTVYDIRQYHEKHNNLFSIEGDFIKNNFPDNSFDYIVMLSTIEHIGFESWGSSYIEDGDFIAIEEIKRIIKPSGKVIITFPFFGEHKIIPGFERWYDIERVKKLFSGLHILAEEYYIPEHVIYNRTLNCFPASLEEIRGVQDKNGLIGFACYVISKKPRNNF